MAIRGCGTIVGGIAAAQDSVRVLVIGGRISGVFHHSAQVVVGLRNRGRRHRSAGTAISEPAGTVGTIGNTTIGGIPSGQVGPDRAVDGRSIDRIGFGPDAGIALSTFAHGKPVRPGIDSLAETGSGV